ncbi:hypothetical protein FQA39_LY04133 [Lamprigera yunnana]|nr:hypothetical protein FQA39_LY04133 [Lamprigera yunnana]
MQCTAEEIERKRKLALEKLNNKKKIKATNSNLENQQPFRFKSPNTNALSDFNGSPIASKFSLGSYAKPVQVQSFYGKNNVVTANCTLISENTFLVEVSGYSQPVIDIFKTIKSKAFDRETKFWNFHLNDYDLLIQKLAILHPNVLVLKLPSYVVQCCKTPQPNYSNIDLSNIDKELLNLLMPFQVDGIRFGIDKQGRCLIADEMGLGKTFQALAIANYYINDWPLLIATTSSMKNEWEATIHKYLPSISIMHTQYMVSAKDYIGDAKILIVSYDMMGRCVEKLLERQFKVLIMDESHNLKNFKTKCTKAATELSRQAKRVILLSGTPALSRPSELYTQLAMLDEKFFGNFFEYSKRYCDAKSTNFGWDANGKSNLQELEIILAKKFMIRRTKNDVLKCLPNKEQQIIKLDVKLDQFSEEDRNYLNALADEYSQQKSNKQAILLTFFNETCKIKIPSVCSFILQTLESKQKFIVFAHHQKMLDAIAQILHSKKVEYIRIDGNTNSVQRKNFIDKFQFNDNFVCAILSITAANAGITLTAAKLVIFAELHWNPSILSQAESRAHRMGQDEKVVVKYLIAPGTADDSIWPLLQNKQKILKEIGLLKESFDNVDVINQNLSHELTSLKKDNTAFTVKKHFKSNEERHEKKSSEDLFNDDFDEEFLKFEDNDNKNNNCALKRKFFDDDFDELLDHHMNVSCDNLLDDGFDDILSSVQLNMCILCLALTIENWKYSFIKYSNVLKFINKDQFVVCSKKMSQLSHHDKAVLNCIFNPNLPVDEAYNEELGDDVKDVDVNTPNVIQSKQLECQGIKLAEERCFQEALKFLKEAIGVTPQRASPYNNRAQIYQLKGDVESMAFLKILLYISLDAFSDLNKAIELGSKNEEKRTLCQAYCQRGLLYRKNEQTELAKSDFGQAARLGSSFAKNQLVQLNPYSALCNQMLRQAFDALK